jgi:hypothetical protein
MANDMTDVWGDGECDRPGIRGKAPRPSVIGGTAKGKARATPKATEGGGAGAPADGRKKAARTAMYRGAHGHGLGQAWVGSRIFSSRVFISSCTETTKSWMTWPQG